MKHELQDKFFPVLDKGFVRLVDFMGTDESVVQAARVSYGEGTKKKSDSKTLVRYLMRHRHSTPTEAAVVKIHMRLPIDVVRQLIRHRTFSYSEYSTRYSVAIDATKETKTNKWRLQSKNNKQGSDGYADPIVGQMLSAGERQLHDLTRRVYQERLNLGVAREQARKDLTLATYSELYMTGNLHNWFHFLGLRLDSHAQEEIREYAGVIAAIFKELFPASFDAFIDYRFCARTFSRLEMEVLPSAMSELEHNGYVKDNGYTRSQAKLIGMSKGEIEEFLEKLNPIEPPKFQLPEPLSSEALASMNHSNE